VLSVAEARSASSSAIYQRSRRWRETGRVLEKRRHAELAAQSPTQSRLAAFDMLQLGGMLPVDPAREQRSGLSEMQRLFVRGHGCGRT